MQPTLAFCVDRHDKIQSFEPVPYWVVVPTVQSSSSGNSFTLSWDRDREFDQRAAQNLYSKVKKAGKAVVTKVEKKEKRKPPPAALNTVELLRVASASLGIGPHQTMQVAERLYTQGYISYPRTETTQFSPQFDVRATLKQQLSSSDWGKQVSDLMTRGIGRPKSGKDCGDHPPSKYQNFPNVSKFSQCIKIFPMYQNFPNVSKMSFQIFTVHPLRCASRNEFHDHDSWRIFEYVCRHFVAIFSGDLIYEQTTAHFDVGGERYTKQGSTPIVPGFTDVMTWLAIPPEERLPSNIQVGQEWMVINVVLSERKTSPPDYLSEADLISLMEKHGIGTDASIPTHINNICQRNYVKVAGGRRLIPTRLGIVLVHGYQKIDSDLVLPTSRANMEKELNQIAAGRADFHQVLTTALKDFKQKFIFFRDNINAMDELFQVSFSSLADSGKPLSKCGHCRRYMKLIMAKPVRLYCPVSVLSIR